MAPTRCAENSETPELRHSPFPPWAALCKSTTVRRSWNMSRAMLAVVLSPVAPPQTNAMKPRDQTSQAPPFKRLSRPEGPDPRGQYPALQVARAAVAPQTGGDWGSSRFPRLITISYDAMAGVVGFEPTIHGTKNRCLTAWLHPNIDALVTRGGAKDQEVLGKKYPLFSLFPAPGPIPASPTGTGTGLIENGPTRGRGSKSAWCWPSSGGSA